MTAAAALACATRIVKSTNTPSYPEEIVSALRHIAPFEIFAFVEYYNDRPPTFLDHNMGAFTNLKVLDNYLSGTYLLDAAYTACRNGIDSGLYRLSELAPDDYFSSEFYNSADFHPCISDQPGSLAEEILYIARRSSNSCLAFSLMRTTSMSPFDNKEFSGLKSMQEIVVETMLRQWPLQILIEPAEHAAADDTLEKAFSTFAHDTLSPREQTIVSLLLRGHSSLSIAHTLDIAEGTAKVHRKHIYAKLGISSQAQLFLLFCNHIVDAQSHATA